MKNFLYINNVVAFTIRRMDGSMSSKGLICPSLSGIMGCAYRYILMYDSIPNGVS